MEKFKEVNAEVEMVNTDGQPKIIFTQFIKSFGRLGKEIKISPKANVTLNKEGYKAEYFVETVSVCVGIGKDHTAEVIMTKDAWESLNSGEQIHITTTEEFKNEYVKPKK